MTPTETTAMGLDRTTPTDPTVGLPYEALLHRVVLGEAFARHHHAILPPTRFWGRLEALYDARPREFLATHCDRIDRLILADHRAELRLPAPAPRPGAPSVGVLIPPRPLPESSGPAAVPEPASAVLLAAALAIAAAAILYRRLA